VFGKVLDSNQLHRTRRRQHAIFQVKDSLQNNSKPTFLFKARVEMMLKQFNNFNLIQIFISIFYDPGSAKTFGNAANKYGHTAFLSQLTMS
jgi:hypothetical protein